MFGFLKRRPPPSLRPSNPGVGATFRFGFANGERSWTEEFDTVKLASAALRELGHTFTAHKTWLEHSSGFLLTPQFVSLTPLEGGGVRTVTTIQTNHPQFVPDGVFEYQHSRGDSSADSILKGFDEWAQTDFLALVEATRPDPEACTTLKLELPVGEGQPPRRRRAILGTATHYATHPQSESCANTSEDKHSFCPCCLFTNSYDAFKALFEGEGFFAMRLFAARDEDGSALADCRVNGDDYPAGAEALREYVTTWPLAGYEYRKQYVILQDYPRKT